MSSIEKFKIFYKKEKERIDFKLEEFNEKLLEEENDIIRQNLELFRNLNSNGKIIRGSLVHLGYYLLKDDLEYPTDLALAYEVFQTAILVHDDIIDNDNKRRGKDTIHFANYEFYKKYCKNLEELKHFSNSIALCMGDYGLYCANQIIVNKYFQDSNFGRVLSNFNQTVLTTIRGELIDVILPFQGKYDLISFDQIEKQILEIYRLKTSYYTIIGPLSVGLILAGCCDEKLKDIEEFGEKVGIAFQIQDDILGIYSDEMGKVKGSDIKEFKQTILYSYILNTEYREEFFNYYGKENISEDTIKKVQELFQISSAYDYSIRFMNKMYDEALEKLEMISWIEEEKKDYLRGFVEYLRVRNK